MLVDFNTLREYSKRQRAGTLVSPQAPLKYSDTERAIALAMRSTYLVLGTGIVVLRRWDAAQQ